MIRPTMRCRWCKTRLIFPQIEETGKREPVEEEPAPDGDVLVYAGVGFEGPHGRVIPKDQVKFFSEHTKLHKRHRCPKQVDPGPAPEGEMFF